MRIIVAGAGEVGSHLAKMLSQENHDIVLIDPDEEKLKQIRANLDVLTRTGSATSISLLIDSDVKRADLFIAVATSEEINITASILSKRLGAKKTIARIIIAFFILFFIAIQILVEKQIIIFRPNLLQISRHDHSMHSDAWHLVSPINHSLPGHHN